MTCKLCKAQKARADGFCSDLCRDDYRAIYGAWAKTQTLIPEAPKLKGKR